MKSVILLLVVLVVILIQGAWAEELAGTWQYKGEEGVIVDYTFLPGGQGVLSVKTLGEIREILFKYTLRDIDGKQYLYALVEIPEAKAKGVEISEIKFLSEDRIQSRAVNVYMIEEKDISLYLLQPLPTLTAEPKYLFDTTVTTRQILSPGLEEQPKILEKVNN